MATAEEILLKLREIQASVEEIPTLLQIAPRQIITITGLSDIDGNLGLIKAGEFRSGNNRQPGEGFSGVRIAFPSMRYPSTSVSSSDLWNIAGVDNDRLMVGVRSSDGTLVAGAGRMEVDVTGVAIEETGFVSADFDTGERYFRIFNANYSERLSLNTYNPIASGTDWDIQGSNFFRAGNISDSATRPYPAIGWVYNYRTADTSIASTNTVGLSTSLRQWGGLLQMDVSSDNLLRLEIQFIENGGGDSGQFDIGFTNAGRFASGSSQTAWVINWPWGRQPFYAVTSNESQIWIDTTGEVRLGDTAASGSTSWYLSRSTSTGSMTLLNDTTLATASTSISFTAISTAYTSLRVFGRLQTDQTAAQGILGNFNNDSGANYEYLVTRVGSGGLATASVSTGATFFYWGTATPNAADTSFFTSMDVMISFYKNASGYKVYSGKGFFHDAGGAATNLQNEQSGGTWRNSTAEISIIQIKPAAGGFVAGTRVQLFGIS